jgi:hypothetical protein
MIKYLAEKASDALKELLTEDSLQDRLKHAGARLSSAMLEDTKSLSPELQQLIEEYKKLPDDTPRPHKATVLRQLLETIFEEWGKEHS